MYWNLVVKYKLSQYQNQTSVPRKSLIEGEIDKIIKDHPFSENVDFDSLKDIVRETYIYNTKNIIAINVVGALYSELNGNIYGFDKKRKVIWFSKESYEFLLQFKSSLEKLNYFSWILWMENNLRIANKEGSNLASKLDSSTQRNLLSYLKTIC